MQELIIILVSISLIDVWSHEIVVPFVLKDYERGTLKEFFKLIINRKPFNCERCLSFWVAVELSYHTGDIVYLTIPLIVKFKNRL